MRWIRPKIEWTDINFWKNEDGTYSVALMDRETYKTQRLELTEAEFQAFEPFPQEDSKHVTRAA